MDLIQYHVICRDCSGYDGQEHMSILNMKSEREFNITEYTLSTKVKEINGKQLACKRCNSNNYEVFNVKLNDIKYFNLNFIRKRCQKENRYLILFFIGKKNGYPAYEAERDEMPLDILKALTSEMKRIIQSMPKQYFTNIETHGNFFFSISCDKYKSFRIERLSIIGVDYDEVLTELDSFITDTLES